MTGQLCTFVWICFVESLCFYMLRPSPPHDRVAVRTLAVYTVNYLESHIRIWNPTLLAQICFTMAKSYVFYLQVFLVWLILMFMMAKTIPELVEKDKPVLPLVYDIDRSSISMLFCLGFSILIKPPWWTVCRVTILTILLHAHAGLCLTRLAPILRGARDGVSSYNLFVNVLALIYSGLLDLLMITWCWASNQL